MKYNIIKGESKHIDALANLWLELMKVHSEIDKNYFSNSANNLHQYKNMLKEEISNPNFKLFVAETDSNKIIGFILAGKSRGYSLYNSNLFCIIHDIFVINEYQSIGIGKSLINSVIDWSKSQKINKLEVSIFAKNKKSVEFYKRIGFEDLWVVKDLNI